MTEKKTRSRKPRAKKAPVKAVADSPTLDEKKMVEEGFEKTRVRDKAGHYVKDDPSTPENEAWEWQKPEEEAPVVVKKPAAPKPVVVAETPPEPVVEVTPAPEVYANPALESIANRFKRNRAQRRAGRG